MHRQPPTTTLFPYTTLFRSVREKSGGDFPQDANEQLWGAIGAVFDSWNNQRAITYRKLNQIPDDWGTAVNVQSMVFRSEEHTSELQSPMYLVCRLLLEKKKK